MKNFKFFTVEKKIEKHFNRNHISQMLKKNVENTKQNNTNY